VKEVKTGQPIYIMIDPVLKKVLIVLIIIASVITMASAWFQYSLHDVRDNVNDIEYLNASQQLWLGSIGVIPMMFILAICMTVFALYRLMRVELAKTSLRVEMGLRQITTRFAGVVHGAFLRLDPLLFNVTELVQKIDPILEGLTEFVDVYRPTK
jgi:hypothetical protein